MSFEIKTSKEIQERINLYSANNKWVRVTDVTDWIDDLRKSNNMWRYPVDECFGLLEAELSEESKSEATEATKSDTTDIKSDTTTDIKTEIELLMAGKPDYEKAFNILMEYWDGLPDEDKVNIDKRLKRCNL